MNKVYEVITYEQKNNVTDEMILKQSQTFQDQLEGLNGLLSRKLAKSKDGKWLDCVLWASMADAKVASKAIEDAENDEAFMNLVKGDSVTFTYFDVVDDYM